MKQSKRLPSFSGVAANSVATLNIPTGKTLHQLYLTRGGTTFANSHIGDIVLKANGKSIWETTGNFLDPMQEHDGLQEAGANVTVLDFERPGLLLPAWIEATKIGTGAPYNNDPASPLYNPDPITSLTLDVEIKSSAVAPTLVADANLTGPSTSYGIVKRRKFTRTGTGPGVLEISDLPKGDPINRIWIFSPLNRVTHVEMKRDSYDDFSRSRDLNVHIQGDGVKVPQANWFVIDPTEKGIGSEAIVTRGVQDFRLNLTLNATETVEVYVDYLGGLSGN